MFFVLTRFGRAVREHFRRQARVSALGLLTDHQLLDLGLRRDQLDLLRLPDDTPVRHAEPTRAHPQRASLQGCG